MVSAAKGKATPGGARRRGSNNGAADGPIRQATARGEPTPAEPKGTATPGTARRRGSSTGAAYEQIRQAIVQGELKPGEPLVEAVLAEWCGVSRTPIREALTRLETDGIAVRSDRGLIVRLDSAEDVLDLYETRIALEATAARMAAERRTSHDLLQMRQIAQHLVAMRPGDSWTMVEANSRLHRQIWHATHNRSLLDLLDRLSLHLARYPATTLLYPGRWERANGQHIEIIDAIEQRDAERAAALAAEHFTESRDIRLKLWAEGLSA